MEKLDIINQKIKFNPVLIHRLIAREAGRHINGLSEPCYSVDTKKFQYIVYRHLGVDEKDWKAAAKESEDTLGPKGKGDTSRVPFTFALTYLVYRYIKANKIKMANDILLYHFVKTYGSLREKYFPKFCDSDTFRYTIDNLVKVHAFYREKTVAGALIYWTVATNKRWFQKIKNSQEWNPELMHDYMVEIRNKVNQSTRSFTQAYMRNIEDGKKVSAEKEAENADEKNLLQTTTSASGQAAIEKYLKSVYVYKNKDNKAAVDAKKFSRAKNNLAEMVIPMILDKSFEENIKTILTNFYKELMNQHMDAESMCGEKMIRLVRKLMLIRNYKDTYAFKSLVVSLTDSMVDRLDPMARKMTIRDRVNLDTFVALYITIRFRNLFC